MAFFRQSICLILALFTLFLCSFTEGYRFYVGGRDGWVLHPSESYSSWAQRNRFQVNDTLVFRFKKGENSALLVTKENYNKCNIINPIKSLIEENSVYKFERSGPHYFISGTQDNCNKSQKIIIVVLAIRPKKPGPGPAPTPIPTPIPRPVGPGSQAPSSDSDSDSDSDNPGSSPGSNPGSSPGSPGEEKKNGASVVHGSWSTIWVVGLSVVLVGFGMFG